MEFVTLYFNECSQIRYATVQLLRNRLAQVVPGLKQRPLPDPENYKRMFINPLDNSKNLSEEYLQSLQNAPEAYRRRFFLG